MTWILFFFLIVTNCTLVYALIKLDALREEQEDMRDAFKRQFKHQIRFNQMLYGRVEEIEKKLHEQTEEMR